MQALKIALTIFVALLLEMLLSKRLGFFQYLDLTLIISVYFGLQRAPLLGMLTGATAGLAADVVKGGILGVGGFSKTLIGYVIAVISVKFPLENPLMRLGVVAVASVLNTMLYIGLNLMLDREPPYISTWVEFGKTIGWQALADTLACIFVFAALDKIFPDQPAASRMEIKKRFYE